jgi:hypothetical protein
MSEGIKNRVIRALNALYADDLEEALFQIAPAIDATAQKRYPGKKPGFRTRAFLKDEQELIYGFSTQNRVMVSLGTTIIFGNDGEFQSILYKFVRCAQSHDAALDTSKVTLGGDFGIGCFFIEGASLKPQPGTVLISKATIFALIFAVVCAIENARLDLSDFAIPFFSEPSMPLAPFVGNRAGFIQKYSAFFT